MVDFYQLIVRLIQFLSNNNDTSGMSRLSLSSYKFEDSVKEQGVIYYSYLTDNASGGLLLSG